MATSAGQSNEPVPLTRNEIQAELIDLSEWKISGDGTRIFRSLRMKSFLHALAYFERLAVLAESENHHPDLHLTGYRHVRVELWTHTLGGVSLNDIAMARRIDVVPIDG